LDPSAKPTFHLIVGLGNPGPQYVRTRHNIGFMILDQLADKMGVHFHGAKAWNAEVVNHGGVSLCKPLSFMNRSGEPTRAVGDYFKIAAEDTLVVLDDAALPLGQLRLRASGSAGGHNGLQSVIDHFGTQNVARLRFGIGPAEGKTGLADHVLSLFAPEEMPAVESGIDRAVEAISFVQENGLEAAMNKFNQPTKDNP
jgi:PTH1 family peptidyl-tRNA hydrolase